MEELDIVELLYALKNKIVYVIIAVVAFALAGLIYSKFFITPMYKSSTSFVLSKSVNTTTSGEDNTNNEAITANDITLNSKLVSTDSKIIKSKTVAKEVIASLGLDMNTDTFISNISVSNETDTELIIITVSNEEPQLAANIANSLAEVFRDKVNDIYNIDNLSVIDIAEPDLIPYNISPVKTILLFALVGLFVACGVIFVMVYFDDTVKDEKDIESLLSIPVIAAIPKMENDERGGKA